ncbi:MAG: OmpA family protein [bacterium]
MSIRGLLEKMAVACVFALVFAGCSTTKPEQTGLDGSGVANGTDMVLEPQPTGTGTKVAVQFENVLFDFDSAKIGNAEYAKIEAVATFLNGNPNSYAILEGHCDERGTSEYNMTLGERRADSVRAHLLGLKIDGTRLFPKSFGEEKPADQGHSDAAWRANRRVEFGLYRK